MYYYTEMENLYQGFTFSRTIIHDGGNVNVNSFAFTFENNILSDINQYNDEMNRVISKYHFMDIPIEPEIKNLKSLDDGEFLSKITVGMKKGTVFRVIGKPDHSHERDGREIWSFQGYNIKELLDAMDARQVEQSKNPLSVFMQIPDMVDGVQSGFEAKSYTIILKDNTVVDRYISRNADLTPEEKACIPE